MVSLKKFSSENNEGKPFSIAATDKEPVFGYTAKQYVKVYRPHSEMRFLYAGDFGENYCFGLEQLPAKGGFYSLITGSEERYVIEPDGSRGSMLSASIRKR